MCVLSFFLFCDPLSHGIKRRKTRRGEAHYLDSMQNEKVYFGSFTRKQCRDEEWGVCVGQKSYVNDIFY